MSGYRRDILSTQIARFHRQFREQLVTIIKLLGKLGVSKSFACYLKHGPIPKRDYRTEEGLYQHFTLSN